METLLFAFNAISPIILQICLGYFLARIGFLKKEFLKNANRLVFTVGIPTLLFINVYSVESFKEINMSLVLYCVLFILAVFLVGIIIVKLLVRDDNQKGVVLQCIFRSNFAIIGLPLAESLGGNEAKAAVAVLSAFSIPLFGILSVISLSLWKDTGADSRKRIRGILKDIVTNPLIIGVVLGVIVLGLREISGGFTIKGDLPFIYNTIDSISRITTPLALIVLGGQFDFKTTRDNLKEIGLSVVSRIIIVPALALFIASVMSSKLGWPVINADCYPALVALFATPVAVASAVMADQMDNDGRLADQLVVWTSLFSIITVYFFIVILRFAGLL